MPFLSIVRRAWLETRSFTQRFSLGTQNRRSCRFGNQRRRVLLLACETLLPVCTPFPVTWHTRAMMTSVFVLFERAVHRPLARAISAQRRCAPRDAGG